MTSRVRSVRLPDALWERLRIVSQARGMSVSTLILAALMDYLEVQRWEKR
ncbi:MAG: ribbon-helix-helix protein, CopG family [Caulobacteraceae bacterium]|nr:ribbon-helix-helix protein, CopG family [Caulobacteraceae bacterium]